MQDADGATVHDITYVGPKGPISAFLVVPDGDGPFPAVLFMPGAPGVPDEFLVEAGELARRGILSLLPDPPYSRPQFEDVVDFTPRDEDGIVQEVTEMRRGIDLLVSRDDVDPNRLGHVASTGAGRSAASSRGSSAASAPSSSCPRSRA